MRRPEELRRRFSDGYRIEVTVDDATRARAAERLAGVGTLETTGQGFAGVCRPSIAMRSGVSSVSRRAARGALLDRAAGDDRRRPSPARLRGSRGMNRRRLWTLIRREVQATFRDRFTVTILILAPIFALAIFGFILSTDVHHLSLGLFDAARSASTRRIAAELGANGTFDVREYSSVDAIGDALGNGTISVGIVMPADFDDDLRRSGTARACRFSMTAEKRRSRETRRPRCRLGSRPPPIRSAIAPRARPASSAKTVSA